MRNFDFSTLQEQFDRINLRSLDELDGVLSTALQRKGGKARSEKDYEVDELQIRYEASERTLYHHARRYFSATGQQSNETYTM